MKKLTAIAATLAAILVLPGAIGAANAANNDDTLFGRDKFDIERSLADRGFNATNVEQWGQVIVAQVKNPDGSQVTQFFDKDNLQPVRANGAALTSGASTGVTPYGIGDFGNNNTSLVE